MGNIQPIIDLCVQYNSNFATKNWYTAHQWIQDGCDIEKDIVPTLQIMMNRNRGIKTLSYFTNPVIEARDRRLAQEKLTRKEAPRTPEQELAWLKSIAWYRKYGKEHLCRDPDAFAKLDAYEAAHGRVMP